MDPSTVYFPSAVALGALHALEPGHAKTLTAAYLIGTKGTKSDAVLLGLSVATTHSIVVIGLSVGAVLLGREAFTEDASRWLAIISGAIVVVLGIWLLWKRLNTLRRARHLGELEHSHSHAPDPQPVDGELGTGEVGIVNTSLGERMRLTLKTGIPKLVVRVEIRRGPVQIETLMLARQDEKGLVWQSEVAPKEPHEFQAAVIWSDGIRTESIAFEVHEPDHHDAEHDHAHMTDDEHARAHAATLPSYVHQGERPTAWQIVAFGGAGGLIPCPAAVTVMLLSVSIAKTANGLLLVLGFSIGLAITLVGIGLAVVSGLSRLSGSGRLSWLSKHAPIISAALVMTSGAVGLVLAVVKGH